MRPLISVCVPTYNQEHTIADALDSILRQKNCQFHIIIANDGSTDMTDSICRKYKSLYPDKITYISQKSNKGIVENTKDCLLAATSDYIAICEGDDYWIDDQKLNKQLTVLESDDKVSMVHTAWVDYLCESDEFRSVIFEDKKYICDYSNGTESVREILYGNYRGIRFSSIMFRNSDFKFILNKHTNFFCPEFSTLDIGFFYCFAYYGRLHFIKDITTVYRIHDGSVSVNKNTSRQCYFSIGVSYANCYFAHEFGITQTEISQIGKKGISNVSKFLLENGDTEISSRIRNLINSYPIKISLGQRIILAISNFRRMRKLMLSILKIIR